MTNTTTQTETTETILQLVAVDQLGPDATADDCAAHCERVEAYLDEHHSEHDWTIRPTRSTEIEGTWVGDWRNGRQVSIRGSVSAEYDWINDALDAAWEAAEREDEPATLTVGQIIDAATGEDRDTGTVVEIDGDDCTVAWSSSDRTTQPIATVLAAMAAADAEDAEYVSAHTVRDYNTSVDLVGEPSPELVAESEAVTDTGAVPAYRDEDGVWQYVAPCDVTHYRHHRGETVITVYVD